MVTLRKFALTLSVLFCWVSPALLAQSRSREAPRQLGGSLVFGWTQSTAREFFEDSRSNPFTTLRLDYQDYLLNPSFLTYSARGRLSKGFQEGFSGISEGSGIALDTTFLPARPWPFRFYYSRFRRSSRTAGLSSSYARFVSQNDDSTLGFQWRFAVPHLPALDLSFDKISSSATPETVLTQGFDTRARTFMLNVRDRRLGWLLNGSASWQRSDTHFLLGAARGAVLLDNRSKIRNLNLQANRPIGKILNFLFSANRSTNKFDFDGGGLDQAFDSLSARVEYRPGRFQASSQVRLTRSELDSRSSQLIGTPTFLAPSVRVSNRLYDVEARYQLRPYLTFFGKSEFSQVTAPDIRSVRVTGNAWNAVSGVQFLRQFKSVSFGSSYFLYSTLSRLRKDSETNLLGHAFDLSASAGDPSRLHLSGLFALTRSREDVRNLFLTNSDSERVQLALSRLLLHRWTLELQGGLSRIRYKRPGLHSDFLNRDYGASFRGPHFYLGYSRSIGSGDSFQSLLGLPVGPPSGPSPPLLQLIASSNAASTLSGSWNLNHTLTLRGVWRGQLQSVGPLLNSRFEQQEATLEWLFRKLRLEGGYQVYRYNFGSPVLRKVIIFRVTRDFRIF